MLTDQQVNEIANLFADCIRKACDVLDDDDGGGGTLDSIDISKVGVNFGPELENFIPAENPGKIFSKGRMFWLMEKDYDGRIPVNSGEYPKVCLEPCNNITCNPWTGSFASNKNRLCGQNGARHIFEEVTVSPEVIVGQNGEFKKFPNKHYTMAEWGTPENAKIWMERFLKSCGSVCDVIELGNEPWGYTPAEWASLEEKFVEGYKENIAEFKTRLSTAAIPIGIGNNNPWTGTLEQFVNFPQDYHIMQFHAYALEGTTWTDNPQIVINQIQQAQQFHEQHMPHTELRLTEVGFPITAGNQQEHLQTILQYCENNGIDATFIYRLTFEANDGPFRGTSLQKENGEFTDLYKWLEVLSNEQTPTNNNGFSVTIPLTPVSNELQLAYSFQPNLSFEFKLFTPDGQLLQTQTSTSNNGQVMMDVSSYRQGDYLLVSYQNGKLLETNKIKVRR